MNNSSSILGHRNGEFATLQPLLPGHQDPQSESELSLKYIIIKSMTCVHRGMESDTSERRWFYNSHFN